MNFGSEGIEAPMVRLSAPKMARFLDLRPQSKACTGTPNGYDVTYRK